MSIIWRDLTNTEMKQLEDKTFRSAHNQFQQLIRIKDPKETSEVFTKTITYGSVGTRLAAKVNK